VKARRNASLPRASESQQQLAQRLRPDDITKLLGGLQAAAQRREDRTAVAVLGAVILWLNATSGLALAADRRLTLARCADCYGQVNLPGEVADLIVRVRQVAP
jgi:hypothetical protein